MTGRHTAGPGAAESGRSPVRRLLALALVVAMSTATVQLTGWAGPDRLRAAVESAGWAGAAVFVVGYALLVLAPSPASLLTVLGGALFGWWLGTVLVWTGALLGATGGFLLGRWLGRPAVDRMLRGRLRQADEVLSGHGVVAVVLVRLVPLFPFTPVNYAAGLVDVRARDYLLGTALGIVPGVAAYASVGASGAEPRALLVGVGGLVLLTVLAGLLGRWLLSGGTATASDDRYVA